jgi:hypothetical protein
MAMSRTLGLVLGVLGVLGGSHCLGQTYRCDWSVVGIGGGEMSSGAYKCVATAGQTAAGFMTSPDYWALVGFWLPEGRSGVQTEPPGSGTPTNRLYSPQPNPFRDRTVIRYSLATDEPAMLQVYDGVGRLVRSWAVSRRPSAVSFVTWDGRDNAGRTLAAGVYFCKFSAGDYRATQKLVVQR